MRTQRLVAYLVVAVLAFGAFTIAATIALTSGHSAWKGHTLTHNASIDSGTTLRAPAGTYYDD